MKSQDKNNEKIHFDRNIGESSEFENMAMDLEIGNEIVIEEYIINETEETTCISECTEKVQIVNMNNNLQDDRIAAALLEENETSSDDENFVPYSDDESDHISVASEVPSDTDVEEAEINIEPYSDDTASTPQPFYLGKDGRTKWYKLPPRTMFGQGPKI
ncbi:unnamed protein product [Diatraea saccharalis]|uniref:Uncharacterized protein n=1 Tax=Diatraea saccharalis TaxID=40085 RepID=A0A9N9QTH1_9NEOP|nr:unnamed protein product [Diatraea saccharalis]